MDLNALIKPFAGLVIAASGTVPGKRHDQIKRIVQRGGGKFADLDISDCTHLITTVGAVRTQKVMYARQLKGCDIVTVDWFLESVDKMMPLDTKKFLLKFPSLVKLRTPATTDSRQPDKKRKLETDDEGGNHLAQSPKDRVEANFGKLSALVADDFPVDKKNTAVWMDQNDVIWDATLVKDYSRVDTGTGMKMWNASVYRVQLLFDVKTKRYSTFARWVRGGHSPKCYYLGQHNFDLQSEQDAFHLAFTEKSGLEWDSRDHVPYEGMYVFVDCRYEKAHTEAPMLVLRETLGTAPLLPFPVRHVLDMLFHPEKRPQIEAMINTLYGHRLKVILGGRFEHTLRMGTSLLDRICELPVDFRGNRSLANQRIFKILSQAYFGLMWHSGYQGPADESWIEEERNTYDFLRKLNALHTIMGELSWTKDELLGAAHQVLGLPHMTPLEHDSAEFTELICYFALSFGQDHPRATVMDVFRLNRAGEAERLSQWSCTNNDKSGQRRLLWHGSGFQKFVGILSQGLRMNVFHSRTTAMFGQGIYFADMAGKSINFCSGRHGGIGLLLLCEVEVGRRMLNMAGANQNAGSLVRAEGSKSCAVFAQGQTSHKSWRDAGLVNPELKGILMPDVREGKCLQYTATKLGHDEYVVYDPAQVRQRYLFQVMVG